MLAADSGLDVADLLLDALPLVRGGVRAPGQRLQGFEVGGLVVGGFDQHERVNRLEAMVADRVNRSN